MNQIRLWSLLGRGKVICICNVHSVITARRNPIFAKVLARADLATPDGAPLAWMLRRLGHRDQSRINGPDLMLRYCSEADDLTSPIYLYGSSPETLARLRATLNQQFPRLRIAGWDSPPFRPLTPEEEAQAVSRINLSGAGVVWVSLGCPKQEIWMDKHRDVVNAVMIGVGAAFDYHAGTIQRAPPLFQDLGLEWLFRLFSEPRRLWKRYLITNSLFIYHAALQLIDMRRKNSK